MYEESLNTYFITSSLSLVCYNTCMAILIYSGEDVFRLEKSLNERLRTFGIDKNHIVTIEANDKRSFQIENVLMECDTFSLFDDDLKAVILKNPFFLSATNKEADKVLKTDSASVKKRKENEIAKRDKRLKQLESYCMHENQSTILVFACIGYQADSRKKDFKLLTKYGAEVFTFQKMDDKEFLSYVDKQLQKKHYTLTKEAKDELLQRVNLDTTAFHQALEKIDLYGKKDLDIEDIKHLVSLNGDVNIFAFTSNYLKGDISRCMQIMQDMLQANYDYLAMIALLAKRLRTLYNMRLLYEEGLRNDMIATRMHVKSGYVYYALKDVSHMQAKDILDDLNALAQLDQGIKQGTLEAKNSFEIFLMKQRKRTYARY